MSTTKVPAGRIAAAYVDDGQGRRLVLADYTKHGFALDRPLVIATHQGEARAVIAAIHGLLEELPPAPPQGGEDE